MINRYWIQLRSYLLSLFRRSLKTHASIWVEDLDISLAFYKRLGFRPVKRTRSNEVILLRNHMGDELNLVKQWSSDAKRLSNTTLTFEVANIEKQHAQLLQWYSGVEIISHESSRRISLVDPDANTLEFYELLNSRQRAGKRIFHIVTQEEFFAGLSDHYYVPPQGPRNRFLLTRPRSAILDLTCNRVAQEAGGTPLVVEMVQEKLSLEEQVVLDADFDSNESSTFGTYPHVNSPIARQAITALGICTHTNEGYTWPKSFTNIEQLRNL